MMAATAEEVWSLDDAEQVRRVSIKVKDTPENITKLLQATGGRRCSHRGARRCSSVIFGTTYPHKLCPPCLTTARKAPSKAAAAVAPRGSAAEAIRKYREEQVLLNEQLELLKLDKQEELRKAGRVSHPPTLVESVNAWWHGEKVEKEVIIVERETESESEEPVSLSVHAAPCCTVFFLLCTDCLSLCTGRW